MQLMMEFMPKDASTTEESMFMNDDGAVYVTHVFPPRMNDMDLYNELHLDIKLDRHVEFREMAERTSDLAHYCQL